MRTSKAGFPKGEACGRDTLPSDDFYYFILRKPVFGSPVALKPSRGIAALQLLKYLTLVSLGCGILVTCGPIRC